MNTNKEIKKTLQIEPLCSLMSDASTGKTPRTSRTKHTPLPGTTSQGLPQR